MIIFVCCLFFGLFVIFLVCVYFFRSPIFAIHAATLVGSDSSVERVEELESIKQTITKELDD